MKNIFYIFNILLGLNFKHVNKIFYKYHHFKFLLRTENFTLEIEAAWSLYKKETNWKWNVKIYIPRRWTQKQYSQSHP